MSDTLRQSQPAISLQPPPSSSGSNFFDPAFTSGLGGNLAEGMDFDWAAQDVFGIVIKHRLNVTLQERSN